MYFLPKWIKFSVKKTKHLKNTGKMAKNTGKVREKSGNFVSPEKWEPCNTRALVRKKTKHKNNDFKDACQSASS